MRLICNPLLRSTLLSDRDLLETAPQELPRAPWCHLLCFPGRLGHVCVWGGAAKSSHDCNAWVHKLRPWLRDKRLHSVLLGSLFRLFCSLPPLQECGLWCLASSPGLSVLKMLIYPTAASASPGAPGQRQGKEVRKETAWLMAPFRRGGGGRNGPLLQLSLISLMGPNYPCPACGFSLGPTCRDDG